MFVDKDHILTKIESSSEEKKLIMWGKYEKYNYSNRKSNFK